MHEKFELGKNHRTLRPLNSSIVSITLMGTSNSMRERESGGEGERVEEGWIPVKPRRAHNRGVLRLTEQVGGLVPISELSRDYGNGVVLTIFVKNFPETCRMKDLWFSLRKVGCLVDLFCPNKLDKSGKRFGFARFKVKSAEYR